MFGPGRRLDGRITAGSRKQRINSPYKSLARNFFRSLALKNQEEIMMMTEEGQGEMEGGKKKSKGRAERKSRDLQW